MKFNVKLVVIISLCLIAINEASYLKINRRNRYKLQGDEEKVKPHNSDNLGFHGIDKNGKAVKNEVLKQLTLPLPPAPNQEPTEVKGGGNFYKSCKNISYDARTFKLSASCQDMSSKENPTSLDLRKCYTVTFSDVLTYSKTFIWAYNHFCRNCKVDLKTLMFTCDCKYYTKSDLTTTLNLNAFIKNMDGRLLC
jgi:hypothetical protein